MWRGGGVLSITGSAQHFLDPVHGGSVGHCPRNRRYEIPVLPHVAGRNVNNFVHEFQERELGTSAGGEVDERERGHDVLLVQCEAGSRLEPRNVVIQRRNPGTQQADLIILDTQINDFLTR